MPFLQVHTSRPLEPDAKRRLGAALARAYGELMETNHRIVNVAFSFYPAGDVARYDAEDGGPQEMTIVTADIRTGRSEAVQETLARAVSGLCANALGIDEARVAVYLTEHGAYQIYRDGGRAPDWTPEERLSG